MTKSPSKSPRKSPSKRHRATVEGGSYQQLLPFDDDSFLDVYAREDHLMKVGRNFTAPPTRTTHKSDEYWRTATSWAPLDDPNFALDPHDTWYNESVDAPIMQDAAPAVEAAGQKNKLRSKVAVCLHQSTTISFIILIRIFQRRPHVVWKESYRSIFLDEMTRCAGRGDFRTAHRCPDCLARREGVPCQAVYRCNECFLPDLTCESCIVRRHDRLPFHRVEVGIFRFTSSMR
jgi:hypothetical protein